MAVGLVLAMLAAGCAGQTVKQQEPRGLMEYCGTEPSSMATAFAAEDVASIAYSYTMDTVMECVITDEEEIKSLYDAVAAIQVEEETEERATDSDDYFQFILQNGDTCTFHFEHHHFVNGDKAYLLSNDKELWKLAAALRGR